MATADAKLPPELVEASVHLGKAAALVAGATSRYLEGRGLSHTAASGLGDAIAHIARANSAIHDAPHIHVLLDERPAGHRSVRPVG